MRRIFLGTGVLMLVSSCFVLSALADERARPSVLHLAEWGDNYGGTPQGNEGGGYGDDQDGGGYDGGSDQSNKPNDYEPEYDNGSDQKSGGYSSGKSSYGGQGGGAEGGSGQGGGKPSGGNKQSVDACKATCRDKCQTSFVPGSRKEKACTILCGRQCLN